MSWKTPRVVRGELHEVGTPDAVSLDSPAWFGWLADDAHRCFHFVHPAGDFTARKERKQRGHWYWVAYRQMHGRLYKTYLGKTDTLTRARLDAAATDLANAEHRVAAAPSADEPITS
jgi:LuxR family transcriptional regulator, maltose regulon positive regulatory protein